MYDLTNFKSALEEGLKVSWMHISVEKAQQGSSVSVCVTMTLSPWKYIKGEQYLSYASLLNEQMRFKKIKSQTLYFMYSVCAFIIVL